MAEAHEVGVSVGSAESDDSGSNSGDYSVSDSPSNTEADGVDHGEPLLLEDSTVDAEEVLAVNTKPGRGTSGRIPTINEAKEKTPCSKCG